MLHCGAIGGDELKDAAWYYPDTKETAEHIKGYVAFCKPALLASDDAHTDLWAGQTRAKLKLRIRSERLLGVRKGRFALPGYKTVNFRHICC